MKWSEKMSASPRRRQALLLLVHQNSHCLDELIRLMDNGRSDFFVHVDAKAKGFDRRRVAGAVRRGRLTWVEPVSVRWGTPSMVEAELRLFAAAAAADEQYSYYHLLSGADLPVRGADEIYDFFDAASDCFIDTEPMLPDFADRITLRHIAWLTLPPSARPTPGNRLRRLGSRLWLGVQRRLGLRRAWSRAWPKPVHGSQWCSLPHEAVVELLEQRRLIRRMVRASFSPDEMYKQTILCAKPERFRLSPLADLRFIDWSTDAAHPASISPAHFAAIDASADLFARKFDSPEVADAFQMRHENHAKSDV